MVAKKKKIKQQKNFWASEAGKKTFIIILALVAFAGLVVVIQGFPDRGPGAQNGMGADGFSVYEIEGADLGIAAAVEKSVVESELGAHAKKVEDVDASGVINYNGNKGQTATYYFTTSDGLLGSFYVDVMEYKSKQAYDNENVFANTSDAGKIQGFEARHMKAITIANEREYAILVTKDLKSYKFSITQPFKNVKISETTAHNILKRIAEKAKL